MIVVLCTKGKKEDVERVMVKLFPEENRAAAEKFIEDNTDPDKDEKYWTYAEIISEGEFYIPSRYQNF